MNDGRVWDALMTVMLLMLQLFSASQGHDVGESALCT
jgi:hypothetical protein